MSTQGRNTQILKKVFIPSHTEFQSYAVTVIIRLTDTEVGWYNRELTSFYSLFTQVLDLCTCLKANIT